MLGELCNKITEIWTTGRKTKLSPTSGWISGNAVCCTHNGESVDTRGRAGIKVEDMVLSYHCFNCNYAASYRVGQHLSYKFRKLLAWMGADDNTVRKMVIDAIRIKDFIGPEHITNKPDEVQHDFTARNLPEDSVKLGSDRPDLTDYLIKRGIDLARYDFYYTEQTSYNLHRRIIVPCTWQNKIVGYTARAIDDTVKPKYHSNYENSYVFNTDKQLPDSKFVIVCEGAFDAMSIDAVAVMGNNCSESQADIIDALKREIIVVPDSDRAGKKLISAALEYGWSVSFPVWQEKYKDINDAAVNLGRLFVLKSILDGTETSRLKIELRSKKLYS
jgi:hypothetical protein